MNSVQQTILGLVLVGIAFIFGSYLHNDGDTQLANSSAEGMNNLAWQGKAGEKSETTNPFSQKATGAQSSMPRLQPYRLVEANLVPDLNTTMLQEAAPVPKVRSQEIAEPDFSRFAFEDSEPTGEVTPIGAASEISSPEFQSYFPEKISSNIDRIEPKMPQRDLNENSIEIDSQELAVIQRRLSFDAPEYDQAPPNPNKLRSNSEPDLRVSRVRQISPIQTQTAVTAIRPRTSSPMMMNATEFLNHETAQGETLQQLAVKYFGDAAYYLDIYVANKGLLDDPAQVPAGVQLRIPVYK